MTGTFWVMATASLGLSLIGANASAQGRETELPAPPPYEFNPSTQIPRVPAPATVKPGFTFASAGDMIYSLPMTPRKDPGVEAIARIVRSADAALANQEGSIFNLETFGGYLEAQNGGGYPVGKPELAADIAALGIDFAAKANNHAVDFGVLGIMESKRNLEDAGVRAPGAGRDRAFARAAALLDTPHGRVAVISAASTFPGSAPAGLGEGIGGGRPGISVVRTRRVAIVSESDMQSLRAVADRLGARASRDPKLLMLNGQVYRVGDKPGMTYEINDVDLFEILRTVRGAKNIADAAVFTIHAHEGGATDRVPADFQQILYHKVIDAGADIVAVHGPHVTRGIEIYRGKPIFYGLGHFVFQMLGSAPNMREDFEASRTDPRFVANGDSDMSGFPADWYDGAVAVTEFGAGGAVKQIRLYPVDLRKDEPLKSRGIPQLATGARANAILEQISTDSAPYGTKISITNGIGVIAFP